MSEPTPDSAPNTNMSEPTPDSPPPLDDSSDDETETEEQGQFRVLAFSGSTRQDSLNHKLACNAATIAGQLGAKVTVIQLRDYDLPLYDGDLEKQHGLPEHARELRALMDDHHAVVIACPEYNGSLTGALKNTIDWLSRDENAKPSLGVFKRRFALMSASPGPGGGTRAVAHLKAVLQSLGGQVVDPVLCVPSAYDAFAADNTLSNAALRRTLHSEMTKLLCEI
jgi:NAD(P)H-dependent FMN reductase